jgi:hypothetical protein
MSSHELYNVGRIRLGSLGNSEGGEEQSRQQRRRGTRAEEWPETRRRGGVNVARGGAQA